VRKNSVNALDLFQVACLAVQVHALTAVAWSRAHGHAGLLPEELADGIPAIMAGLRGELR
jgi:NAD(P)H-hydrate repair Nnr-like enzyme with NAD(P)H-hydrate dehydratase domain